MMVLMTINTINIHGVLLLDKPFGISSAKAVSRVKHLFAVKKAGHTGSLDPLATGLLPICLGQATKFSAYLLDADKVYQTVATLGVTTTTADCEGDVVTTRPVTTLTSQQLDELAATFTGHLTQIPSMYSALKHQGKPLYQLARQGIEVERKPRPIHIKSLVIDDYVDNTLHMTVHCSKGTYIRNLVEDMGEALGCGAHVSQLRRIGVGGYSQAMMIDLPTLNDATPAERLAYLQPTGSLCQYPPIIIDETMVRTLRYGQTVTLTPAQIQTMGQPVPGLVCAFAQDKQFIGLVTLTDEWRLVAKRMMSQE